MQKATLKMQHVKVTTRVLMAVPGFGLDRGALPLLSSYQAGGRKIRTRYWLSPADRTGPGCIAIRFSLCMVR
jgi:hypothetical protein